MREQVSTARRTCGPAVVALRRRCAGCRAGGLFHARGYDLLLASAPLASTASSRHARTLRALSGSPSTVLALGHVRLELGAPAGTCGPSPIPAAGPKRPSTRPARLHQNTTKKFPRMLRFTPPAQARRFEQLQRVGQPTAPVASRQSTRKGPAMLPTEKKRGRLARFGTMTRGGRPFLGKNGRGFKISM